MRILIVIAVLFVLAWGALWWAARDELRSHVGVGFAANFLIPAACAAMVPSLSLFYLSIFVVTLATVRSRIDAVCRFVLLAALLPNPTYYVAIGSSALFVTNTHIILAISALVAAAIRPPSGQPALRGFTPEDALVVVLMLVWWIGGTRFPSLIAFSREGLNGVLVLLCYLVFRVHVRSAEDLRRVVASLAGSGFILGAFAAYETLHHWTLFQNMEANIVPYATQQRHFNLRGGLLRPSVSMSGPLMLTCYLSLTALAAAISRKMFRYSLAGFACFGFILFACVLGQSRGNLIVLGLGILLLLALQRKWVSAGAFLGLAAIGAAVALSVTIGTRGIGGMFDAGDGYMYNGRLYTDYREVLLYRGFEEAMRQPLTGMSLATVLDRLADLTQGEGIIDLVNVYLNIFLVSGLAGLVPAVGLMLAVLYRVLRKARDLTETGLAMRAFLVAGLGALFVEFVFMSYIDRMPLMLFLLVAGVRVFVLGRDFTTDGVTDVTDGAPIRRKLVESDVDADGRPGHVVSDAPVFAG